MIRKILYVAAFIFADTAFGQYLDEAKILELFENPQQQTSDYQPPILNPEQTKELFEGVPKVKADKVQPTADVPAVGDLRRFDAAIRNQQDLPWCTAFASVSSIENVARQGGFDLDLSEHQHFQTYRVYTLEGAARAAVNTGVIPESGWPYKGRAQPGWESLPKAKTEGWDYVRSVSDVIAAVAKSEPVILGVMTTTSWNSPVGGVVTPTGRSAGGHAIAIVGYNRTAARPYFIFRNSWGSRWGDAGYGYMPFDYCNSYDCGFVKYRAVVAPGKPGPTPTATVTPRPTPVPPPPPAPCSWWRRLFGLCE